MSYWIRQTYRYILNGQDPKSVRYDLPIKLGDLYIRLDGFLDFEGAINYERKRKKNVLPST